jgi:hypothetical protein
MHIQKTIAKVLGTYIQIYFLFINEELITNMKLALTKVLNRSVIILCKINKIKIVMLCAFLAWEFMANTCLLKMQSMQNTTVCTTGNLAGAPQSVICRWHYRFCIFFITELNYVIGQVCGQT